MLLNVLYFARLRENLGLAQEQITLQSTRSCVSDLLDYLRARGPQWQATLAAEKNLRVAVNQDLARFETALKDGDEVALFPPVTGG